MKMKKIAWVSGIVVGLYVLSAIVAWRLIPSRIKDADKRLFGVRVAIAQLLRDQQLVSERMRTITNATLARGKNKIAEVSMLLGDPDLNHLASTYMGSDWSLQRSSFFGQVAHTRNLLNTQHAARKKAKSHLNEKIEELEARKRSLMHKLRTPSEDRSWHVEMDDIERQLAMFRSSNTYREYIAKDNEESKHIEESARNEDSLFKLATDYQVATVGKLNQILAEHLNTLRWEENAPVRWRRAGSFFNIWPINLMMRIPMGEEDEKRL